jgi:hypothetical protein
VGLAVGVERQQPGQAGLLQRRGGGVLRREHGLGTGRPLDAEVRVEGMHAVLTSRRVRGRAQVDDGRLVADGGEGVSQPRFEEHGATAGVVQAHRLPAAVTGRADPDIDDHVKDRAADARDVLRLAGRNAREMHAPDDSPAGHRPVGLRGLRPVPERLRQLTGPEPFQEMPPVVPVHGGRKRPGTADTGRLHVSLTPVLRQPLDPAAAMLHFDREGTLAGGSVVEHRVIGTSLRGQTRQARPARSQQ